MGDAYKIRLKFSFWAWGGGLLALIVRSTQTPIRKANMMKTFPERFEVRITPHSASAWKKANLVI